MVRTLALLLTAAVAASAAPRNTPTEPATVQALLALGRSRQPSREPLVVARLRDPRPAVRALAVYAIGLIASGRESGAVLLGLGDPNGAVRVAALDAADRYAAAHLIPATMERGMVSRIERVLGSDPDPIVRARAAATLESFSDTAYGPKIVLVLVHAIESDRASLVRRFAMWTIFRGYAAAAPHAFLRRMLNDRDEVVRIEAVHAIGKRKDPSDAAFVKPLLADPSWRVQEQASETIRLLDGLTLTQHWTAIPAFVHVPPPQPDPLRGLPALPRVALYGKLRAPTAADVRRFVHTLPVLDPKTAAAMGGPAPGPHPRVRIVTTKGDIYVVLFPEWAPVTVVNFLMLADRGYYDDNRWFRIVPDFVVQTGDPNGNGNGDAGYSIHSEENPIAQDSYVISMGLNYTNPPNAHALRDSAGAQYYITLSPQLHLDRDFTVFGEVTSGFDVLGRLVESDRVVRIVRIADETLPLHRGYLLP